MGQAIVEHYFGDQQCAYSVSTISLKNVSNYTGLTFKELDALTYVEYRVYLVDAWIYSQMQSKEGIEFLNRLKELQTG